MVRKALRALPVVVLLIPLVSWVLWLLSPSRALRVLIVDKTSLTPEGREHRAFNWVLTHERYLKPDGFAYRVSEDYAGFMPLADGAYTIRGPERVPDEQIDSLRARYDMTYYTDTYGVDRKDWYADDPSRRQSGGLLYGGLQRKDLLFLESMKRHGRLIIAEFNFFADPTSDSVRSAAEREFGLRWTGWTGRYFERLDTADNDELPHWIVDAVTSQQGGWSYHGAGLVFAHQSGRVAILEYPRDLSRPMPSVETTDHEQLRFGIPGSITYPYWFDITLADSAHTVISYYILSPTPAGDSVLHANSIPTIFPAVIEQREQYRFYYFAGDFADAPILNTFWAHFKGMVWLRAKMAGRTDETDRRRFYWNYYYPLIRRILEENRTYAPHISPGIR